MSSDKERERICFRLRLVDEDLREATRGLTGDKLSDLARDGLRLILGIRTTKRVEVNVRPIVTAAPTQPTQSTPEPQTIRSKPAVYVPNQQQQRRV